jgi:rRNA maturation RNase YbeY
MAVLIDNRQSRHPIPVKKIHREAKVILSALGSPDDELSIVYVDDDRIAELNRAYLDREGPTNVISFPMQEGEFSHLCPHLLGDVVISVDTALREAQSARIPKDRRLTELLVHGVLHLYGYDHEEEGADAAAMEEKARELLDLVAASTAEGGNAPG